MKVDYTCGRANYARQESINSLIVVQKPRSIFSHNFHNLWLTRQCDVVSQPEANQFRKAKPNPSLCPFRMKINSTTQAFTD